MKKEKATKEKQPLTWVDTLDFKQLFTIKGYKDNIYTICTKPNKSGMILMEEFLTTKRGWHSKKYLISLNSYTFYQNSGKELNIRQVFTNIENNTQAIEKKEDKKAMELIVPGYDPNKFKDYHAERVCYWFALIKTPYLLMLKEKSEELKEAEVVKETEKA